MLVRNNALLSARRLLGSAVGILVTVLVGDASIVRACCWWDDRAPGVLPELPEVVMDGGRSLRTNLAVNEGNSSEYQQCA